MCFELAKCPPFFRYLLTAINMRGAFPIFLLMLRLFDTIFHFLAKLASKVIDLPPVDTPIVHFLKLKRKGARSPSVIIVASYAKPNNSTPNVHAKEKKALRFSLLLSKKVRFTNVQSLYIYLIHESTPSCRSHKNSRYCYLPQWFT